MSETQDETAWLIEGPDQKYLSVREHNRTFIWAKDHAEALRFSRQFDAIGVMCVAKTFQPEIFDGGVWERTKPVEHMWVKP